MLTSDFAAKNFFFFSAGDFFFFFVWIGFSLGSEPEKDGD